MNRFTFVLKLVFNIINFLVETSKKKNWKLCVLYSQQSEHFSIHRIAQNYSLHLWF